MKVDSREPLVVYGRLQRDSRGIDGSLSRRVSLSFQYLGETLRMVDLFFLSLVLFPLTSNTMVVGILRGSGIRKVSESYDLFSKLVDWEKPSRIETPEGPY